MKVYISVDIEGICGYVHWEQSTPESGQREEMRRLMVGEANAAVAGAFDGGATEVLVNDSHASQRNIPPLELDRRARLISGNTKPLSMMQGIEESFDAVFLVGYHAGAGCKGLLSHTYTGCVTEVRLNGQVAGEVDINAAVAGYFGVPVALVTGDSAVCRDAVAALGAVETVPVKEPISRYSASCLQPETAREHVRSGARNALARIAEFEPYTFDPPARLELEFKHAGHADRASLMPGSDRVDPVTVAYASEDFIQVYRAFLTMLALADTVS